MFYGSKSCALMKHGQRVTVPKNALKENEFTSKKLLEGRSNQDHLDFGQRPSTVPVSRSNETSCRGQYGCRDQYENKLKYKKWKW